MNPSVLSILYLRWTGPETVKISFRKSNKLKVNVKQRTKVKQCVNVSQKPVMHEVKMALGRDLNLKTHKK